jgi:hypothetical protein
MPNYNSQNPPYAVFPGDVVSAFNSENPSPGQASQQFALAEYSGDPDQSRTIRWQTLFGTAPTAANIALQGALQDIDAQYFTLDTSTNTSGESRAVAGVRTKFLRAKLVSITGGSGLTVLLTT